MKKSALMMALAAASATLAHAQEADYELVTTAIHKRTADTALPVTVISEAELQTLATATLGDTLGQQPGIHNASFGPAVGQTVIRGQQGRRVMNLSNGVPIADASGNSADHAVAVEPLLASSIEVLRGPSTLLFGSGAIGGVVNVLDDSIHDSLSQENRFAVEARHDSASDLDTVVGRADVVSGNLVFHLDAVRRDWNDLDIPGFAVAPGYGEDADHEDEAHEEEHEEEHAPEEDDHDAPENTLGHVPNTGGRTETFNTGVSWVGEQGFLGFSVSHLDSFYGLPDGTHIHGEEDHGDEEPHEEEHLDEVHDEEEHDEEAHEGESVFIDLKSTRYDLAGEWRGNGSLIEQLDYRLSYTDYEHFEIEGATPGTRFRNKAWQQRLQITHQAFSGWHGVVGWQSEISEFSARGEESFIPAVDIESNGLFLVEDFHTDNATYELGARINRDEYDPEGLAAPTRDFTTYSLSGSVLWDFSDTLSLGLSLSRSERAPAVEELYANFNLDHVEDCVVHLANSACEIGNLALEEEQSLNGDLSLYLDFPLLSATISLFHNQYEDYIFLDNAGEEVDDFPVRQFTQNDARFRGLEVDTVIPLSDSWQLKVFGDMVSSDIDDFGDAPRMPPRRLGSELRFEQSRWSAWTRVLHAADQDDPGRNELPTEGYTRWDAGIGYQFDLPAGARAQLFLKARNITDDEIRLATSFLRGYAPESGRSLEAGVRLRF